MRATASMIAMTNPNDTYQAAVQLILPLLGLQPHLPEPLPLSATVPVMATICVM